MKRKEGTDDAGRTEAVTTADPGVGEDRGRKSTRDVVESEPMAFGELQSGTALAARRGDLTLVRDVPVRVSVVLGKKTMEVAEILKFHQGYVIELDKTAGDALEIYVNNRLIAEGQAVMADQGRIGVRLSDVIRDERRPGQEEE